MARRRSGMLALLAFVLACGRAAPKGGPTILLIGVDGLDPARVTAMAAAGALPHLQALMDAGTFAPLATFSNHSEEIWTTIATGVLPPRHGIEVRYLDRTIYNSTMRKAPALWNVLTRYDRRSAVLGWWVTFPAEQVNGYVVTPYLTFQPRRAPSAAWGDDGGRTWPPELRHRVEPLLLDEDDVPSAEAARYAGPPGEMKLARWALANDATWQRIATELLATDPAVDLFAVYTRAVDVISHDYTHWVYGLIFPKPVTPPPQRVSDTERATALAAVDAVYRRADAMIGDLVARVPSSTTVLVVSDHGWAYDGTEHWNHNPGVLLARGPTIAHGARLEAAHVLDVAPTVLALLGVPLSAELEGRVLQELFRPGTLPPIQRVASWGIAPQRTETRETPYDGEQRDRLRALGYIE